MENIYKPIAVFNHKGIKYCIVLVNGNICFFKYVNNNILPAYSEEELKLFWAVHNSLKIDTHKINPLRIEKMDNKDYEIFYDKQTGLHYWYRVINNRRYQPTEEDNIKLNFKYNHISQVVFDEELFDWEEHEKAKVEEQREKKCKKIIRNIEICGFSLVIALVATANIIDYSYAPLAQDIRGKLAGIGVNVESRFNPYESYEKLNQKLAEQEYNYDDIQHAIDNNKNLSDDEKAYLSKFKFLFDENHQYMDTDEIAKRLATINFVYKKDKCSSEEVKGSYERESNCITLYQTKSINDAKISILVHETMHVFQRNKSSRFTMELTNEILTREVLRRMDELGLIENSDVFNDETGNHTRYSEGYDPCMNIGYLLANILTPEQLRTYQFTCRDDYLIDALVSIDTEGRNLEEGSLDKEALSNKAVQLLDEIDSLRIRDDSGKHNRVIYTTDKYLSIRNLFDSYYKTKYGMNADKYTDAIAINYDAKYIKLNPGSEFQFAGFCRGVTKSIQDKYNLNDEQIREYTHNAMYVPMYILPKTFFSDTHPRTIVIADTKETTQVEIDDKFIEYYDIAYEGTKENCREYFSEQNSEFYNVLYKDDEISSQNKMDLER